MAIMKNKKSLDILLTLFCLAVLLVLTLAACNGEVSPTEPVTEPTLPPVTVPQDSALLTEEDVAYVEMNYSASRNPDIEALLTKPLMWSLTGEDPAVLIVHTHGTEAFTPTEDRTYE